MKWTCLIVLFALAGSGALRAQTNLNSAAKLPAADPPGAPAATPPAPAVSNPPAINPQAPRTQTKIKSLHFEFDLEARQATYSGRVRVDDPKMKLTCEQMTANVPQASERVNRIVAETNVIIDFMDDKGQTNHATGDKAVYVFDVKDGMTNEIIKLTGNAKVETPEITMTGEPIVWNRATGKITADNPVITSRQSLLGANPGTNSPPTPANPPPAAN